MRLCTQSAVVSDVTKHDLDHRSEEQSKEVLSSLSDVSIKKVCIHRADISLQKGLGHLTFLIDLRNSKTGPMVVASASFLKASNQTL